MSLWQVLLLSFGVVLIVYVVLLLGLVIAGRGTEARVAARFIPDCLVLFRRLLADSRVAWWRKLLLAALIAYLAMPIDLVPDFIPVAGQLDDVIVVVLVLRIVLRAGGEPLLREHWPGPQQSLELIRRLAYGTHG